MREFLLKKSGNCMVTYPAYALKKVLFTMCFVHLQILDGKQRRQSGRSFPTGCVMLDGL